MEGRFWGYLFAGVLVVLNHFHLRGFNKLQGEGSLTSGNQCITDIL